MSNIEKIRQEIERRAKFHDDAMKACTGLNNIALTHSAGWKEDTELLAFIDSLPEEKPSYVTDSPGDPGNPGEPGISDLEEAAEEYERENRQSILSSVDIVDAFIAGAEWQKEQDATQRK